MSYNIILHDIILYYVTLYPPLARALEAHALVHSRGHGAADGRLPPRWHPQDSAPAKQVHGPTGT